MCIPDENFFYTYMLLFLIQDLGSGDEKVRKSEECRHLGKEHFRQAEDHCGLNSYPTDTLKLCFLVPIKFALIWK